MIKGSCDHIFGWNSAFLKFTILEQIVVVLVEGRVQEKGKAPWEEVNWRDATWPPMQRNTRLPSKNMPVKYLTY